MLKSTDGGLSSVTPSQGLGAADMNKVMSHDNAGSLTMGSDIKDEKLQGLGASDSGMFKNQVSCSNGTGPRELHSWGRCAPTSPQVLGPSVVTLTSRRSYDAPPEGRPSRVGHFNE